MVTLTPHSSQLIISGLSPSSRALVLREAEQLQQSNPERGVSSVELVEIPAGAKLTVYAGWCGYGVWLLCKAV